MKNDKNLCEFSLTLTENPDAWIDSLRHNLFMLVERDDVSLRDLAEAAGVNYDTFKGFLYGDAKNCKLGTVVGIAKAYGFTLDELVGAGTMSPRERSVLQHLRMVPENIQYFIEWAVGFMHRRCIESGHRQKVVALLRPKCMDSSMKMCNDYDVLDISYLSDAIRPRVKMAMKIPCDHYMPLYSPYDVLLIANDRDALPDETVVVISSGHLWLVNRKVVDGKVGYYSIRDGQLRAHEVDECIGYVVAVHTLEKL